MTGLAGVMGIGGGGGGVESVAGCVWFGWLFNWFGVCGGFMKFGELVWVGWCRLVDLGGGCVYCLVDLDEGRGKGEGGVGWFVGLMYCGCGVGLLWGLWCLCGSMCLGGFGRFGGSSRFKWFVRA